MKKSFVFVLAVAMVLGYFYLSHYFILFDDHIKILGKSNLNTSNTFIDARGAKAIGLLSRPDIIKAGPSGGYNG